VEGRGKGMGVGKGREGKGTYGKYVEIEYG
jgi:hypothetical protein